MGAERVNRIGYIDGLRAIAVLSVIATHVALYTKHGGGLLWTLAHEGHHGVDLFFVLSGFCLSYPTLSRLHTGSASFDTAAYAAKRVVRIIPPYWIAIALLAALGPVKVPLADVLRQAAFLDRDTQMLSGSFWSLPIEFRWYFVFPFALVLWAKNERAFFAALALIYLGQATRLVSIDFVVLPKFMLGIVAAAVSIRRPSWSRWAAIAIAPAIVLAFVASPPGDNAATSIFWDVAMFTLVVGGAQIRFLRIRPLVWIGVASYSIYLMNSPAIMLAARYGWLAAATAAIACGALFWMVGERPFVQHTALRSRIIVDCTAVAVQIAKLLRIRVLIPMRASALPPFPDLQPANTAQAAPR